jgi:hypothetical protein
MDAILFIECEKRKENFDYEEEITEDEYVKMLREAGDSILGLDGYRDSLEKKYGMYDVSKMNELNVFANDTNTEELPFNAHLYDMSGNDLTVEHISYFWKDNKPFIVIVEIDEIDNPMVEDTLNIWITNSDYTNNDEKLNDTLILKTLKPKDFGVKIGKLYIRFQYCKMVEKMNANKFALLVNNIEKNTLYNGRNGY